MMPTKQLNSNVVPSIADTDLVTVPSPQGGLQNITFENLMKAVRERIQIGGRNLLRGTNIPGSGYHALTERLTLGEPYVLSFTTVCEIKEGIFCPYLHFPNGTSKALTANTYFEVGTHRYVITFVAAENLISAEYLQAAIGGVTDTGTTIKEIKLEHGNIPTEWSLAPEDIVDKWGVIGCYAINYDSAKKGGAHDANQNACGSACVSSDGHLAFGSLDAMCQFLGRTETFSEYSDMHLSDIELQCGRADRNGVVSSESISHWFPYSFRGQSMSGTERDRRNLPEVLPFRGYWLYVPKIQGREFLVQLGGGIKARKEVAYVAD